MGWTKTRSQIAHAKKRDPHADTSELLRQLKEERLAEHIAKTVAAWPELRRDQLDRLAILLRGENA